jgi:hypothetical protein
MGAAVPAFGHKAQGGRKGVDMRCIAMVFGFLLASTQIAHAHKPSDAYLALSPDGANVAGQWDIALRDLDFAIGLDAAGDGAITWGEVKSKREDIIAYAMSRLTVAADGDTCPATVSEMLIDNHSDGAYAVLRFTAACGHAPDKLQVTYRLFSDIDPQHRGLLRLEMAGQTRTAIFGPEYPRQTFEAGGQSLWRQFVDYWGAGAQHIWTGYDHILFLPSLLMTAVMTRDGGRWRSGHGFLAIFVNALKIVTAFTLAHSITLALATLRIVEIPSRLSESAIALTVALAARNNLCPIVDGMRWIVGFGFGLIHGFGFASALMDLGLPKGALALSLAGFNLGVETGQVAIVAAFLPLAYLARCTWFYRAVVLKGGSWFIAALASLWFLERSLNVRFLPIH